MPTKKKVLVTDNILIENAQLFSKNFSGEAGKFNPAGRRNFCVILDREVAFKLLEDGWNVKWLTPKDPDEEKKAFIQVTVSYANIPPRIIVITSKNKAVLAEDTINILDWAEMTNVDLVINPYNWEMNGKTGIKAYLKTMYVTLVEDKFAEKYKDVPDAASSILEEDVPF